MLIPYNQLMAVHSLTGLITNKVWYMSKHGNETFPRPTHLPLFDTNIADDAKTLVQVQVEAAHQAQLDDFEWYKAAEREIQAFLLATIKDKWYNDLNDATPSTKWWWPLRPTTASATPTAHRLRMALGSGGTMIRVHGGCCHEEGGQKQCQGRECLSYSTGCYAKTHTKIHLAETTTDQYFGKVFSRWCTIYCLIKWNV